MDIILGALVRLVIGLGGWLGVWCMRSGFGIVHTEYSEHVS
jgi:hypothetical protein